MRQCMGTIGLQNEDGSAGGGEGVRGGEGTCKRSLYHDSFSGELQVLPGLREYLRGLGE